MLNLNNKIYNYNKGYVKNKDVVNKLDFLHTESIHDFLNFSLIFFENGIGLRQKIESSSKQSQILESL